MECKAEYECEEVKDDHTLTTTKCWLGKGAKPAKYRQILMEGFEPGSLARLDKSSAFPPP